MYAAYYSNPPLFMQVTARSPEELTKKVADLDARVKASRRNCNQKTQESEMDFGQALVALKEGRRVARAGWNGKGMFLFLVAGSNFVVNREPLLSIMGEGALVTYRPHIDMKDAEGKVVPWLASQTDMLAEDWVEVSPIAQAEG